MELNLPPKRLKPTFLREMKSEAVLVFCGTLFDLTEENNQSSSIFEDEKFKNEAKEIKNCIDNLKAQINSQIIKEENFGYLIKNRTKKEVYPLFVKELPLIYYTEVLHLCLNEQMKDKQKWIPEFLIFALLCDWFIEQNNSTKLFSFVENFDYCKILSIYEKVSLQSKSSVKQTVNDMYKLSLDLSSKLKKAKFTNYMKK